MVAVESKVTAASISSGVSGAVLAPLVIWAAAALGVDMPENVAVVVGGLLIALFSAVGALVGGYLRKSSTSTVSVGYVEPSSPQVPYQPPGV